MQKGNICKKKQTKNKHLKKLTKEQTTITKQRNDNELMIENTTRQNKTKTKKHVPLKSDIFVCHILL